MSSKFGVASVTVLGVLALATLPAFGQAKAGKSAAVPDISGVWSSPGFAHYDRERLPDTPVIGLTRFNRKDYPFRPGGEELWHRHVSNPPDARTDDPELLCLPWGFPHSALLSNAQHFFQSDGYLVIFYEDMHYTRVIPMDGREHPKGLPPNYYGNSVGKYEGDTAVVDTIGLKPWGLDDSGAQDGDHMFTDAAHFIERFRRTGPTSMSYELTIDDPKIFTKPWTCGSESSHCFPDGRKIANVLGGTGLIPIPEKWTMYLHPEWEVIEQYCEENNKDPGLTQSLPGAKK